MQKEGKSRHQRGGRLLVRGRPHPRSFPRCSSPCGRRQTLASQLTQPIAARERPCYVRNPDPKQVEAGPLFNGFAPGSPGRTRARPSFPPHPFPKRGLSTQDPGRTQRWGAHRGALGAQDPDLEASNHPPTDGSPAPWAPQPSTSTHCRNCGPEQGYHGNDAPPQEEKTHRVSPRPPPSSRPLFVGEQSHAWEGGSSSPCQKERAHSQGSRSHVAGHAGLPRASGRR